MIEVIPRSLDDVMLRAVLDRLPDGVAVVGKDGKLILFNEAAERIAGVWTHFDDFERWVERHEVRLASGGRPQRIEDFPLERALR